MNIFLLFIFLNRTKQKCLSAWVGVGGGNNGGDGELSVCAFGGGALSGPTTTKKIVGATTQHDVVRECEIRSPVCVQTFAMPPPLLLNKSGKWRMISGAAASGFITPVITYHYLVI